MTSLTRLQIAVIERNKRWRLHQLWRDESMRRLLLEEVEFGFSAMDVYCSAAGRDPVHTIDVREWESIMASRAK